MHIYSNFEDLALYCGNIKKEVEREREGGREERWRVEKKKGGVGGVRSWEEGEM